MSLPWLKFSFRAGRAGGLNPIKWLMPDRLHIFMHPQQLTLVRLSGGFKPRMLQQTVIPCLASAGINTSGTNLNAASHWSAVIAALASALGQPAWRNASPRLVLSNHFVHYALIPWNSLLQRAPEKEAYLRHCFSVAYGEPARLWDLRVSDAGLNQPALASGIDQALLAALQAEFNRAGLRLPHIYPYLMVAINQLRYSLAQLATRDSVWLVLLENARICLVLINEGVFRSVKTYAAEPDIPQQISALIRRESVICGLDTTGLPVFVHGSTDGVLAAAERALDDESTSQQLEPMEIRHHPVSRMAAEYWRDSPAANDLPGRHLAARA